VKTEGNKDKRVIRSEKAAAEEEAKNKAIDDAIAAETGVVKEEEVVDALEFAPEKDILATFNGEW
jgi:acyl CoA:acetate/3-ketoacid CoA transferase alpha subunit